MPPRIARCSMRSARCSPISRRRARGRRASFPRSAIRRDLNDANLLVGGSDDLEARDQSVTGIVDFGDMVNSYRVGDLAIAIAYAILGSDDPLAIVSHIVRGYAEHIQLRDDEL